ncbi:MAG: hypothetical protein C0501_14840 [Isosphaera sp.]|nr:hypothetical protein [Isosphaera sp.]
MFGRARLPPSLRLGSAGASPSRPAPLGNETTGARGPAVRTFYNPAGGFQSIGYAADGRVLALDTKARLTAWDVAAGRPDQVGGVPADEPHRWALLKGFRSPAGHVGVLTSEGFHRFDLAARTALPGLDPSAGRVAEASEDGTLAVVNEPRSLRLRLWDVAAAAPLPEHFDLPPGRATNLRYHPVLAPDNRTFAVSVVSDGRLLVWGRGDPVPRLVARTPPGRRYPLLAFPPDGRFLVGAQIRRHGAVTLWDLPAGAPRWSVRQEVFVWAVAVHPSGGLVAVATVGGPDGRVVRFLDAATGEEVNRFRWDAGPGKAVRVRCLAFSPDGTTCAAGGSDRRLVVWDVDG